MRWHKTDSEIRDTKEMIMMEDEGGIGASGFIFRLMICVAQYMKSCNERPACAYTIKRWCEKLSLTRAAWVKYSEIAQNSGFIKLKHFPEVNGSEFVEVEIPYLKDNMDDWTKRKIREQSSGKEEGRKIENPSAATSQTTKKNITPDKANAAKQLPSSQTLGKDPEQAHSRESDQPMSSPAESWTKKDVQNKPIKNCPEMNEPIGTESVKTEPVNMKPVITEPTRGESVLTRGEAAPKHISNNDKNFSDNTKPAHKANQAKDNCPLPETLPWDRKPVLTEKPVPSAGAEANDCPVPAEDECPLPLDPVPWVPESMPAKKDIPHAGGGSVQSGSVRKDMNMAEEMERVLASIPPGYQVSPADAPGYAAYSKWKDSDFVPGPQNRDEYEGDLVHGVYVPDDDSGEEERRRENSEYMEEPEEDGYGEDDDDYGAECSGGEAVLDERAANGLWGSDGHVKKSDDGPIEAESAEIAGGSTPLEGVGGEGKASEEAATSRRDRKFVRDYDIPIEFTELREKYSEIIREEGPLAGFDAYRQARAERILPEMSRILQDLEDRKASGFWNAGFEPGLARYINERTWLAKVVSRQPPPPPKKLTFAEQEEIRFQNMQARAREYDEKKRAEASAREIAGDTVSNTL